METNEAPGAQTNGTKDLWTVASQKLDSQLGTSNYPTNILTVALGTVSTAKTFIFVGEKRSGKTSLI
jgi:hypothetical protein